MAADTVSVYHWHQAGIRDTLIFDADDIGLLNFDRYLRETPKSPAYVLVDIVEEEYRQDRVPHVLGADRRAVIERKQSWLFRGTPYCHAIVQGRETEGRRDDKVLLTAIVNPQVLAPWVRLCSQNKIPVAGIYSLPILSECLLPEIGATSGNTLLVSMQIASGLRQSYFHGGALKISRLAKMPRIGTVPFAPYVLGEVEKLQRYLNNLQLLAPGPLHVYVLAHGDLLDELARACRATESQHYHLLDVSDLAARLGIEEGLAMPYSDHLFAHLLLQRTPLNHYAQGSERNYFRLYQARCGLWAASLALVVVGSIGSGMNLLSGISFKEQAARAEQRANFYEARFKSAKDELPPTAVEPLDIRTAVDLADTLSKYKSKPLETLSVIGHVLADFPNLHVDEIRWLASADSSSDMGVKDHDGGIDMVSAHPATESHYESVLIKGYLEPFDGDYREALSAINRFAEALRSQRAVHDVRVVGLPLDTSSGANLQGNTAGAVSEEATFSVKLVLGVGRETG